MKDLDIYVAVASLAVIAFVVPTAVIAVIWDAPVIVMKWIVTIGIVSLATFCYSAFLVNINH